MIILYPLLTLIAITILFPLVWMVYSAFKTDSEIFSNVFALPHHFYFGNFRTVVASGGLGRAFLNSLLITSVSVFGIVFFASLAAYAFAIFEFKGKEILFVYFLVGLIVPPGFLIITGFKLMAVLSLINSYWSLILTYLGFISFAVLVLRNFFETVPREIKEAARIDGASHWAMYSKIMMPLARPAIAIICILYFVWLWNDFIYPLVYLESQDKYTLTVAVLNLSGRYEPQWGLQMAGFTIAVIVPVGIYLVFQRQFIRGMFAGAVKG